LEGLNQLKRNSQGEFSGTTNMLSMNHAGNVIFGWVKSGNNLRATPEVKDTGLLDKEEIYAICKKNTSTSAGILLDERDGFKIHTDDNFFPTII